MAAEARAGVHPGVFILSWIFFSNVTILFNKWLIDTAGFRYPVLLTTWHLIFATIATQLLAHFTTLLSSRTQLRLTGRLYMRTILPIGLLYSGSLVCSNLVYLYLSVAFIQMLKAAAPVAVLLTSWIWRVADPTMGTWANIFVIVFGVGLASLGEIEFSWMGFLFQAAGMAFEAVRLVMIQVMLSGEGLRMDPLVGLYYYAPVCAIMNLLVACVTEIPYFKGEDLARTGFGMLFLNAALAFLLNVSSVFLIGKTSGLVMTLTGMLKNILLVIVSVFIWQTHIAMLQVLGYAIALAGLVYYSLGYDQLVKGYHDATAWAYYKLSERAEIGKPRPSAMRRSMVVIGALGLMSIVPITVIVLHTYGFKGPDFMRYTTEWFGSS
ncbi:Fc.00g050380.m01.CDS01 [Cosmosporella sp. VM-42]